MKVRTGASRTAARPAASRVARGVAVALTVLALGACSSDDDDGDMTDVDDDDDDMEMSEGAEGSPVGSFAVVMNDGMSPGSVQVYSPDLATPAAMGLVQTNANQGIAYGPAGTLYQNGDAADNTGLFAVAADGGATQIGSAPGKGLSYVTGQDLLASCDVTDEDADLKLFSPVSADPAAAPVGTVDLPASCWDTFWDEDNERLYAALTDGSLAILDGFSGDGDAVDRLVTFAAGASNLHGVFAEDGTVLVTDVGAATTPDNGDAFGSDGQLFVLDDSEGDLDGEVDVAPVAGPATMLGNPVDAVLLDGAAIVAEKVNDALLVFEDVADLSGDVAPDYVGAFTKPESIELAPVDDTDAEDTDTEDTDTEDTDTEDTDTEDTDAEDTDGTEDGDTDA